MLHYYYFLPSPFFLLLLPPITFPIAFRQSQFQRLRIAYNNNPNKQKMVDRYQSLLGSEIISDNIDRNMKVDRAFNTNMEMIKRANQRAAKMRQFISKYKRDISADADQYVKQFKQEQREYAKDRNYLKTEVDKLEKAKKKDSSEYNFIKRELIKAVKSELDLQFQLNQEITRRKEEKQLLKKQLFEGSVQIQNAVRDIQAKKEDILYLEKLINQCVQLLEIIGVLVHENGEKINDISREVECANENVEKAERNIDKARIAMQKSRCKWCCVLFIAIVVIVLGVIVYVTSIK